MLEKNEFEDWISASHTLFELFEGRYDAYPLSVIWVKEWFDSNAFTVTKNDVSRISALFEDFSYEAFGCTGHLRDKIDLQLKNLIQTHLKEGKNEQIGFALAPYLFSWNFQRFQEYFKQKEELQPSTVFSTFE